MIRCSRCRANDYTACLCVGGPKPPRDELEPQRYCRKCNASASDPHCLCPEPMDGGKDEEYSIARRVVYTLLGLLLTGVFVTACGIAGLVVWRALS